MICDLLIVAAGKGSRLKADVPKALVPINDVPCLTTNLRLIGNKFKTIYVVCNTDVIDQWNEYMDDMEETEPSLVENVELVEIKSGKGDGHAVLTALQMLYPILTNKIVIAWGDVIFRYPEIIDEIFSLPAYYPAAVPVVLEKDPYVTLLVDEINSVKRCKGADFRKFGEHHLKGYHDQSVFMFTTRTLLSALSNIHRVLWKDDHYTSMGGEMSLLLTFNFLYNSDEYSAPVVYETMYSTLSFNTIEEVSEIMLQLDLELSNGR